MENIAGYLDTSMADTVNALYEQILYAKSAVIDAKVNAEGGADIFRLVEALANNSSELAKMLISLIRSENAEVIQPFVTYILEDASAEVNYLFQYFGNQRIRISRLYSKITRRKAELLLETGNEASTESLQNWADLYYSSINVYWQAINSTIKKARREKTSIFDLEQFFPEMKHILRKIDDFTETLTYQMQIAIANESIRSELSTSTQAYNRYIIANAKIKEEIEAYTKAHIVVTFPDKGKKRKK